MFLRRTTYQIYANRTESAVMDAVAGLHCRIYNAGLEERVDAWRKFGKSISFADQCKSLTELRADDPRHLAVEVGGVWIPVNVSSLQVTLKRLDLAFKAFYRRAASGKEPGFPRYKSRARFAGMGFKGHGDGWRFTPGTNWRHGKLRLQGVGTIKLRGEARTPGRIVSCEILRKPGLGPKGETAWFASVVVECEPHREAGHEVRAFDWGVETFATIASIDDEALAGDDVFRWTNETLAAVTDTTMDNLRHYRAEEASLKVEQRALSAVLRRTPKAKRTKALGKAQIALAKRWRKVANRRKDALHKRSANLVAGASLIIGEDLTIKNMTATAHGTDADPGTNVAQKAGLNRAILDTAPAAFHSMVAYKAEEAGCGCLFLDPRRFASSQHCPVCRTRRKKSLSERTHDCPVCGFVTGRDRASALDLLQAGINETRRIREAALAAELVTAELGRVSALAA